jgi:hypothetical protein
MASAGLIGPADNPLIGLRWDECCDLLGGASWEQAMEQWGSAGLLGSRQATLKALEPHFCHPKQFLFSREDQRYSALESFWLKWNLIVSLCRSVLSLHQQGRQPHLGLEPARVLVNFPSDKDYWLPLRWRFSLELLDTNGVEQLVAHNMPPEMAQSLLVPPVNIEAAYASALIRQWPAGREIPVTCLIRSLDQVQDDCDVLRGLLRIDLISDTIAHEYFCHHDVFRVALTLPQGNGRQIHIWARKVDTLERGVVVSGVTDELTSEEWQALRNASREVFSQATAKTYRAFHIPCDVYSVGMLLCRALLVNKGQTLQQVEACLSHVIERLEPVVQGIDPTDHITMYMRLSSRLKEEGQIFSSTSVLFSQNGWPNSESLLPEDIWYDALLLALRCMSWIPGFSICPSTAVYDMQEIDNPLLEVTRQAEDLGHRIRIELFEAGQRNYEIGEACKRIRSERAGMGIG